MAIVEKSINGNKTTVIECKKDILFTTTNIVDGSIMLGFSDTGEENNLDEIVYDRSYKDYPAKVFIEFHYIKSIDNLIDQLIQTKESLSKELTNE